MKIKKKATKKPARTKQPAAKPETVLVLRTCNPDMTSAHNRQFKWPTSGMVEAPDWDPKPVCGFGLHGLAKGQGDAELMSWEADAKWLVVRVLESDLVAIDNEKVKFPRGEVIYCGDRHTACNMVQAEYPELAVHGATKAAGDVGTATAGYAGTATAGDAGTATAGYAGTATAGYAGTATAGDAGTATAGDAGILILRRLDNVANRYRVEVAYVGESGIKAGIRYRWSDEKKAFVEAS